MNERDFSRCPHCGHHLPVHLSSVSWRWDNARGMVYAPTYEQCPCRHDTPPPRAGQRRDGGKLTAIYPTMLSTFISRLQEIMERHGDIPVVAYAPEDGRTSRVSADILEHYYDGGWLDPAEDTLYHCRHWMKSRTTKANNVAVLVRADEPEHCDTIDGQPVPDCEDD